MLLKHQIRKEEKIFRGCNRNGFDTPLTATKEAPVGALLKAKELGFHHIIVLTRCKYVKEVCNNKRKPFWQDLMMLTDLKALQQQGMKFSIMLVPRVILSDVDDMASLATKNTYPL